MKNNLPQGAHCLPAGRYHKSLGRLLFLLAICYIPYLFSGCGYTTRSMISNKYQSIYIEPFINKVDITNDADAANKYQIYRPMLETEITRNLTNRFLFDGNLKPGQKDLADLTLKGELTQFRRDPLRYTENTDDVEEYRINLVVNLKLWDNKENKLVWEENGFTGSTSYFTVGSSAKSESTAVKEALDDLSRRIVERTVEEW